MRKFLVLMAGMAIVAFMITPAYATGGEAPQPEPAAETAQPGGAEGTAPKAAETYIYLKAPLFSTQFSGFPVAKVDGETITLDELNDALAAVHENAPEQAAGAKKQDFMPVLDRLINTRLLNLEAHEVGIDDLPEVKSAIEDYSKAAMRELVKDRHTKDVKPDKAEVEKLYKEAAREWKIKSVIFQKEADAGKMAEDIKGGKGFDKAAGEYLKSGKANGGEEGKYMRADKLLPQIAEPLLKMKPGEVSPVIRVESGYVVFKVEDMRYAEDPKAREEAERRSLDKRRFEALRKYFGSLKKKYVKVNKKVFDGLDYEAREPGFGGLMKDNRVVAEVKGEKPVTVADLTDAISKKFFHGMEEAVREKKVNDLKTPVLDEVLYKRLFDKEALKEGINKTDEYRKMIKQYKVSVMFSAFIQKVIVPGIKVTEEETKKYYEQHINDFTYPEMAKLYSIGFASVKDADAALKKLEEGTDLKWLKANAEGQLKEDSPAYFAFNGEVMSVKGLPEAMQKTLSGAKAGDFRLYANPEGGYYVLYVKEEIPSKEQPYQQARETIAKKLFNDKLNKSIEDYADKLRKAHEVKVYVTEVGA